jgi:putative hydroxymethylpyrimidine transport system substrate-binding protein
METVTLLLEWFPNPDHVPLYVAQRQFAEALGLDLRLLVPTNPDDALDLVAANRVDLSLNYQPNVILAQSLDRPVVSVGLLIDHTLDTIMYRRGEGIESPVDLRGKRIGVAVSGFDRMMFEAVADAVGLGREEFEPVNVGFNFTRALLDRQVDASMGAFKNYEVVEARLLGADVAYFDLADYGVPDFYQLLLVAHSNTMAQRPATLAALVRAVDMGIRFMLEEPDEALKAFLEVHPELDTLLTRQAFQATLPYFARSQHQEEAHWRRLTEFLRQRGFIAKAPPVSGLYTDQFAPL